MPPRSLIIVPTYNEVDNVAAAARAFLAALPDAEILFVDDNSPDGTGAVIDRLVGDHPTGALHVLHRSGKLGLGTAYLEGFAWALARDHDTIIEMDADFSHDPRFLPALVGRARAGVHVVIGSRYVEGGGTINWGIGRQLISKAGGAYARAVLGMSIKDMTSGFVCYRRDALERLDLGAIRSNGYSFQIEMKYRAYRAGLTLEEIPIVFEDRRVGRSKMSRAIAAEALGVVWKLRLGRR